MDRGLTTVENYLKNPLFIKQGPRPSRKPSFRGVRTFQSYLGEFPLTTPSYGPATTGESYRRGG